MSSPTEAWRLRARTAEAMAALIAARGAISMVPLERWPGWLGLAGPLRETGLDEAQRLARHIERAAGRLPFRSKCLPQAMALSWMLRRRGLAHRLVIAARPAGARRGRDDLHAWVDCAGQIILGDLPGPWAPLFALP